MPPRPSRPRSLGIQTGGIDEGAPYRGPGRRSFPYRVGDRIGGGLTVIGHLAHGRLGHIYQVWSAEWWCALTCKILSPKYRDDGAAIATLRKELEIIGELSHPNLIRGFGGGEHDGLPYLLMEYVAGPSLFDLLEGRPGRKLSISDAVRTALHIGAALNHLHSYGYLYLDLKPANLMVRNRLPVLIDFDTARPVELAAAEDIPRLGTGPYMAPEQVRGERLSFATDQYGLGAVLYEMVTGRWPYEAVYTGEEPRSGDEKEYPQLADQPSTPPSNWNPEISEGLDELIMRALASDTGERYPSLHAFLLALAVQLPDPVALWPEGVIVERRRAPRQQGARADGLEGLSDYYEYDKGLLGA